MGQNKGIYQVKIIGWIGQNYGIYWAKTVGYIKGYIGQKLWDILSKDYGIYWSKTIGYMVLKLCDVYTKNYM